MTQRRGRITSSANLSSNNHPLTPTIQNLRTESHENLQTHLPFSFGFFQPFTFRTNSAVCQGDDLAAAISCRTYLLETLLDASFKPRVLWTTWAFKSRKTRLISSLRSNCWRRSLGSTTCSSGIYGRSQGTSHVLEAASELPFRSTENQCCWWPTTISQLLSSSSSEDRRP